MQTSVKIPDERPARTIRLEESWKNRLAEEFEKPYMAQLREFLAREKAAGKNIFPPGTEMFAALDASPFEKVRVVIIGQDPYHGPGQAHGLSFSVKPGVPLPPSLQNIFKELVADVGTPQPTSGDLTPWARQGVLLLNASLSVEQSRPLSHQDKGWEKFTDKIIEKLNQEREKLVFILWGAFAIKKAQIVDRTKHHVITSPHPSPLSAHRGFLGSKPFSQTNAYLISQGLEPIDWKLP